MYLKLKNDADRAHREKEEEVEKEKKRLDMLKIELASLTSKLERLNAKKDKLEAGLPELQEQHKEMQMKIDSVELETYPDSNSANDFSSDGAKSPNPIARADWTSDTASGYLPIQGARAQHTPTPGGIKHPSPPVPIQRPPTTSGAPSIRNPTLQQSIWPNTTRHGHNQRSSSVQHHPHNSTINLHAHRQSSLHSTSSANGSYNSSTSAAMVTGLPAAPPSGSTLSRTAQPFEPGRPLRTTNTSGSVFAISSLNHAGSLPSRHSTGQNQQWALYDSNGR